MPPDPSPPDPSPAPLLPPFDVTLADVEAARDRLRQEAPRGLLRRTPTFHSPALSARLGRATWVKLEGMQAGGSFKTRGVLNLVLQLPEEARARGLVAVSGGNHAIAVALVARALDLDALVTMTRETPALNVDATRALGARVELCDTPAAAFARADEHAAAGRALVHPFDDPAMIAGGGTAGLEFAEDAPGLTHVFVSIGGGGFAAGVALAMRGRAPDLEVIGVETEGCDAMARALAAGRPVAVRPTSIARTLGAPYVTPRTLAAARALLAGVEVVSDADAVAALAAILEAERVMVEPAASCTLAAAARRAPSLPPDAAIGLVLCGSNVALADVVGWIERFGAGRAP